MKFKQIVLDFETLLSEEQLNEEVWAELDEGNQSEKSTESQEQDDESKLIITILKNKRSEKLKSSEDEAR